MSTTHPWTQDTRTTRGKTATTWDAAGTQSPYRRRSFPLEQESKGDIPKRGWGYVVFTDVTLWVSESPWSRMSDEVRKGKQRAKGGWESWVRDAQRILGLLWGLIWAGKKGLMRAVRRGPRQREVASLGLVAGGKKEYLTRALFTPADGDLEVWGGAVFLQQVEFWAPSLPPSRNGDQNILQRTDTETTDISMKENCPEIDSYIWHDKSIYNKLGPQNRRHKKHDFLSSPHPRDN